MLAGVIDAKTFQEIEENPTGEIAEAAKLCDALEIRYDLLPAGVKWSHVAENIRGRFPRALLVGTIRLERDGGKFPTEKSLGREALWRDILSAAVKPDFIDIEAEDLDELFPKLAKDFSQSGVRFLVSHHDFQKISSTMELENLIQKAKAVRANGFKTACMSSTWGDFEGLYPFIAQNAPDFELFSLFAMGKTGEESRLKSLAFGANLTYCSLGNAVAPGQIPVKIAKENCKNYCKNR